MPGGLYSQSFFVVINKKKWDALPEKDRAAIDKVSGEALAKHLGTRWQREEDTGLDRLTKLGVTVTRVEGELLAREAKNRPVSCTLRP
mgnify:CR=1 FL=1